MKAVQARRFSKGLEFATFKGRVMELLPDPHKLYSVSISHPTVNQTFITKTTRHVGNRNVISLRG